MTHVDLTSQALDALMPMHVLVGSDGAVFGAGRAMQRLFADEPLIGLTLADAFKFERPARVRQISDLIGRRVSLHMRSGRQVQLRGHAVAARGGFLVLNLAIGLGELESFGRTGLTAREFAPTDSTLDMLYLIEAKALATAETHRLIGRLQAAKSAAETEATTDPLTGLTNRRGFDQILSRAIAEEKPFSLAHVDLDHFKAVNDGLGHPAGDAVLVAVAQRLRDIVRASDTVARVGGDEFTIVLHRLTDRETLASIASRIVSSLEEPVSFEGKTCHVSASIGIAISHGGDVADAETMIADVDHALYQSKAEGRARYTFTETGTVI